MTSERRQRLHPNLRRGRGPTDKESVKSPSSRTRGLKRGGSPGRKKGVPNKVTREVQALAQSIVEDPAVQATMLAQEVARKIESEIAYIEGAISIEEARTRGAQ